jgi:nicotinamidase/pyrazinamidase
MKALLIVDLQNDFLPGGALPIQRGNEIIPIINELTRSPFDLIIATKDWHPSDHKSFAEQHKGKKPGDVIDLDGIEQILWPVHCVQKTAGSAFAPGWDTSAVHRVFYKGVDAKIDSYSAFFDNRHQRSTGLGEFLKEQGVTEVYIAGLATDYCVKYSAFDAIHLGFQTYVIANACRAVNLHPNDESKALEEMHLAGTHIINASQ